MHTRLRKLGKSWGVIIPKPLLEQVGIRDEADVAVENGAIVLRPLKRNPREGWAEASSSIAVNASEGLAWPELAKGDAALRWR